MEAIVMYDLILKSFSWLASSQDLFSADWTEGNLYTIESVVNVLGKVSVWVISIVGFGIVIFSILKNAMSGLYVVNPSFWDRVDEVKNQAVGGAQSAIQDITGGNAKAAKLGGFLVWLLGLVPNIKALTDFGESGEIPDKKQYFLHSIPLLVAQIFIGMLIFFGYPTKIANWVGTAGTTVIDMVLNNVDPVDTVTTTASKMAIVEFVSQDSGNPYDQAVYKLSSEACVKVFSRYSDMSKDNKQQFAYAIESEIADAFSECTDVLGAAEGYDVTPYCSPVATNRPNIDKGWTAKGSKGVYASTATNGTISYRMVLPLAGITPTGSTTLAGSGDALLVGFTATPEAIKSSVSNTAVVGFSSLANATTTGSTTTWTLAGAIKYSDTDSNGMIGGTPGTSCTITGYSSDGNQVGTITGSIEKKSDGTLQVTAKTKNQSIFKGASYYDIEMSSNNSLYLYLSTSTQTVKVPIVGFNTKFSSGQVHLSTQADGETLAPSEVLKYINNGNSSED